jgi:hypothetical protein
VSEPSDRQDEEALAALLPDSMALRVARRHPRPRTAEVCVSGIRRDVAIILMTLEAGAGGGRFEITDRRGPYPNRRDPGQRIYVTLRFPGDDTPRAIADSGLESGAS